MSFKQLKPLKPVKPTIKKENYMGCPECKEDRKPPKWVKYVTSYKTCPQINEYICSNNHTFKIRDKKS